MTLFSVWRVAMRNFSLFILLLASTVPVLGCDEERLVSIYPLYDKQTLTFEPGLEGTWKPEGESSSWAFEKTSENRYHLTIAEPQSAGNREAEELVFDVVPVKLAGKLFLDFYSKDSGPTGAPAHVIMRARLEQDAMFLIEPNHAWMRDRLRMESFMKFLEPSDGQLIISTPTPDLRYFFTIHAWNGDAFKEDEELVLRRVVKIVSHAEMFSRNES
jgi:hypothetical protein